MKRTELGLSSAFLLIKPLEVLMSPAQGKTQLTWELSLHPDSELVESIAEKLSLPRQIAAILVNRGLTDSDSVNRFLNPVDRIETG